MKNKNQLQHIWTILAQSSSTDAFNNSFSLSNVIDEIIVKPGEGVLEKGLKFNVPAQFQIATLWKRSENSEGELVGNIKISFVDPKGVELQKIEYSMTIPADKKRMRFLTPVNGLIIDKEGEYKFLIKIKDDDKSEFKDVAEVPLDVIIDKK